MKRTRIPLMGVRGLYRHAKSGYLTGFSLLLILLASCGQQQTETSTTRFTLLDSSHTHIAFSNQITENDTLNYFNFPYLYLGGGVSVGDINNDSLPDLYFTANQTSNKLYLNKGNLQFEDITAFAGVGGDSRWYSGATMVDINHDGWMDIYVSVSGKWGNKANQLFINQGNNTFSEEAAAYGIADTGTSIQATFFDYNKDGYLDLFVANYPAVRVSGGNQYYKDLMDLNRLEDSGHLYKNNGNGSFSDVTETAGVRRFGLTLGIIAADFNQDGWQDLYLSNDFNVPDYLYQNNRDGTFSEVSQQATRHTAMFGMGIDAADCNNDGWLDLFQLDMTAEDYKRSKTNMASMQPSTFYEAVEIGLHYQYMQNALQLNHGVSAQDHPVFSDLSRMTGMATTDWSWGVLMADLNNDGWKDVFITNGVKRDVNNNDVNQEFDAANFWGRELFPDYKRMPSTPISNYAFSNQGNLDFSNVTKAWELDEKGFSNGFSVADLDNDGDLDLVINNLDATASMYANQTSTDKHHYLTIQLKGPDTNPLGLGTKIQLKAGDITQTQELTLTRGYQSSVEARLHFGLGEVNQVDELNILWPDGRQQSLQHIPANQQLDMDYANASPQKQELPTIRQGRFTDITPAVDVKFQHQENPYDDFSVEPLLPHKNSHIGPALAVGDVNQDGRDDFFVGNAAGSPAAMFVQKPDGTFQQMQGPWERDSLFEDTGASLFDADGDGDLDLYVVSGGNQVSQSQDFYQDRIYVQTETGFVQATQSLPANLPSGQSIAVSDYDGDGDLDVFVGGRIVPGKYPYPAKSRLLRNEGGKDLALRYTDVTEEIAPELLSAGLVTTAIWDDFDTDGKPDLILTGEWMPIRFFKNTGTTFQEATESMGLETYKGWWYSLQKADVDGDGDMDYIAGNLGLNYKYQASAEKSFEIYAHDFDENGTTDIVLSYEKYGTKLPLRGRECSSQQVPAIKQRFKTYASFADASLADIYGQHMLDQSLHYQATTFAHHWFEKMEDGSFRPHPLPRAAQTSSINSIQVFDYNQDKYPDLLVAGNLYQAEVETPRADAGVGLVLTGTESGEFNVIPPHESGLMVSGEVKQIRSIQMAHGRRGFLFGRNDLGLKVLGMEQVGKYPGAD